MSTKIQDFINTKKTAVVNNAKSYALAKGKEAAYRGINAALEHEKVKEIDEKISAAILDFAYGKMDAIDSFNTKANTKTASIMDKLARIMSITGISVATMGVIGGVLGSFLTGNFFWLILSAVFLVALGVVIGAGVSYFKADNTVSPKEEKVIELPVVSEVIASIEEKLPHPHLATPELKAA